MEFARPVANVVAIAAIVWLIVTQAVHFHEETLGWAVAALFASFMGLFASEVVMNREVDSPGEHLERVGGSDF
jgi:4-hydroxybenzoate polyprenyltransferase